MDTAKKFLFPWTIYVCDNKKNQEGGNEENQGIKLLFSVLTIIFGIFAGYLCWNCNEKEDTGTRVIYTGLAFLNAVPYLIYYFFIRKVFNQPCK